MNVPYLWVYILFASLTITALILFGIASALQSAGFADRQRRQIVGSAAALLFGWLALDMTLGSLGVFQAGPDRKVPVIAFAILIPIIVGIWMIRSSSVTREVLRVVPQQWMVGVQAYRGLGSIFLILYGWRLLPGVFALPAGFGDTLVGLSALLVAALYATGSPNREWLVAAWNLLGIADLVIAVGTGFLSAPGPAQLFSFAAPNVLVGAYPLVMIPIYAVPLSIVVHAASLTRLAWAHETKRVSAKPASSVA
jgi:hypothetical protein